MGRLSFGGGTELHAGTLAFGGGGIKTAAGTAIFDSAGAKVSTSIAGQIIGIPFESQANLTSNLTTYLSIPGIGGSTSAGMQASARKATLPSGSTTGTVNTLYVALSGNITTGSATFTLFTGATEVAGANVTLNTTVKSYASVVPAASYNTNGGASPIRVRVKTKNTYAPATLEAAGMVWLLLS